MQDALRLKGRCVLSKCRQYLLAAHSASVADAASFRMDHGNLPRSMEEKTFAKSWAAICWPRSVAAPSWVSFQDSQALTGETIFQLPSPLAKSSHTLNIPPEAVARNSFSKSSSTLEFCSDPPDSSSCNRKRRPLTTSFQIVASISLFVSDKSHLYRSIAPSTISIDPITATTSAINRPLDIASSACKFAKSALRMCTRYGLAVPSLTT